MEKPKFVYVTYINSTPEKVWEALTNPEFTRQYWGGHRLQSEWKKGSSIKYVKEDGSVHLEGIVLQVDPPRLLSYTWAAYAGAPAGGDEETRVTFEITTGFDVTKLITTHEGFVPGSQLLGRISEGWPAVLGSLKTLLETGKAITLNFKC